jgi:hypothetical protein
MEKEYENVINPNKSLQTQSKNGKVVISSFSMQNS